LRLGRATAAATGNLAAACGIGTLALVAGTSRILLHPFIPAPFLLLLLLRIVMPTKLIRLLAKVALIKLEWWVGGGGRDGKQSVSAK
jgi:hypothetical protein